MKLKSAPIAILAFAAIILFIKCSTLSKPGLGESIGISDLTLLQGNWVPIEAELGGNQFPDEVRKSIRMEISNDVYTVTVGNNPDKGLIKLNSGARPKEMEIHGTEGPNKGRKIQAIYEISGNSVIICYDLSGKGFPAEFKTDKGTQLFLVKYEKVKE